MKKLRLVDKIKEFFSDNLRQDAIENYKLSSSDLRLLLVLGDQLIFKNSLPILEAKWLEKVIFGKPLDDLVETDGMDAEELKKKKEEFESFVDSLECKNKAANFVNDDLWYFAHFD